MDNQTYSPLGNMPPVVGQPPVAPSQPQFQQPQQPQTPQPAQPYPSATPYPSLAQPPKPKNQAIQIAIFVGLSIVAATAIGLSIWFYTEAEEAKLNQQSKTDLAVAEAKEVQRAELEASFAEREKQPLLEFTGPEDYGRLSFMYPRTWSVYVAKDAAKGGDYEAYFNPRIVGPVSASSPFALRVTIYNRPYDEVLRTFDSLTSSNPPKLTSSVFQVGENTGTRFEGEFSRDITGRAILLKINDKTVYIRTDTPETAGADFENLIQTISFK